jgi:tetratricopeptide (TPR) repeat protein
MSPRPTIFISAVSRELKSARQLVANTLTFLGYEPIWQDIFGTEGGDLRAVLRRQIDASKGVVQLVGHDYGAEPPTADERFGRVSYTQFEALYAKDRGKKVWYLVLDSDFPDDNRDQEPEELRELQAAYRRRLQSDAHLFHPLTSKEALENSVLKLRDDLTRLRRGVKQWATAVAVLLLLSVILGFWMLKGQKRSSEQLAQATTALQGMQDDMAKLRQGMAEFADLHAKARESNPDQNNAEIDEHAYAEIGKRVGMDPKILQEKLPAYAQQLKNSADASPLDRANAAFVAKDYPEAERLAMAAVDTARRAKPPKNMEAISSLMLAGRAAQARIAYDPALEHFRAAEALVDKTRNAPMWSRIESSIAGVYNDLGQFRTAEPILRDVIAERSAALGPEQPEVLAKRLTLAGVLLRGGKHADAEVEARAVLESRSKSLGPNHPETLAARNILASVLNEEGKHREAENEFRALLDLDTKVFGPDNPHTLLVRGNLAAALERERKFAEAESEDRALLAVKRKVFGENHPETLRTRNHLAFVLGQAHKYVEAETEARSVRPLIEKLLGPEHPRTLDSRHNLALALSGQGKDQEAEAEFRDVIKLRTKVLGLDHPETLASRISLAFVLEHEGRLAEAEAEERAVIAAREKRIGANHPITLYSRTRLAGTLQKEHKLAEAETEERAVSDVCKKVLGPQAPMTHNAARVLASILNDEGKTAEATALNAGPAKSQSSPANGEEQ